MKIFENKFEQKDDGTGMELTWLSEGKPVPAPEEKRLIFGGSNGTKRIDSSKKRKLQYYMRLYFLQLFYTSKDKN